MKRFLCVLILFLVAGNTTFAQQMFYPSNPIVSNSHNGISFGPVVGNIDTDNELEFVMTNDGNIFDTNADATVKIIDDGSIVYPGK